MNQVSGDAPSLDDVIKKIVRHQENQEAVQAHAQETRSAVLKRRIRNAFGGTREDPYTPEELQRFQDENGVSREDFTNRWIIQNGVSFYVFKNGRYKKPIGYGELVNTAYKDLAPAYTSGLDVFRITPKGAVVKKSAEELVEQYGTVVESSKATFTLQKSHYDWKTETFEEAVCPLRNLKPEFSQTVDNYFRALGGALYEKLNDWVSVVTQLDKPCSALFLHGVPSAGKTLMASGLTRLWSEGEATDINQVLGSAFNKALMNCPLILADEQLPSFIKKEGSTAELRALIQGTQRRVTRQFKSAIMLKGAVRLIITANNRNLFNKRDALSNEDIEAVQDRILYLYAGQESKDYLSAMTLAERKEMVFGDEIAKHALWLRDNHQHQTVVAIC
ncbi:MAG: primase-helicase family protein [Myxococcaceae bacterium]